MKARDVVGRRIVAVEQERRRAYGGGVYDVRALVFDDGSKLCLVAQEHDDGDEPFVEGVFVPAVASS